MIDSMTAAIRARVPVGLCFARQTLEPASVEMKVLSSSLDRYIDWRFFCALDAPAPTAGSESRAVPPDLCGIIQVSDEAAAFSRDAEVPRPRLWRWLPIESFERLRDEASRESFFLRVLTVYRWRRLLARGLSVTSLQRFYAGHKYLVMSRDIAVYRRLGALLARTTRRDLAGAADEMIGLMLLAFTRPESRAGASNALLHIRGYLKRSLNATEQWELNDRIERYRLGEIALSEPMHVLRRHFRAHPDAYIAQQVFLQPDRWAAFFDADEL